MRIALTTLAAPPSQTGVSNYIAHLVHALARAGPEHQFVVLVSADNRRYYETGADNVRLVPIPLRYSPRCIMRPAYHLWQNTLLLHQLRKHRVDLFHVPNTLPVFAEFVPTVMTVHDVAEFQVRKYGRLRQAYRRFVLQQSLRRVSRIITVSRTTRRLLARHLGVDASRVDVTYEAPCSLDGGEPSRSPDGPDLPEGDYLLYVGSTLPHKNLPRTIRAFARARARDGAVDHTLMLAGSRGHRAAELAGLAAELGVQDEVRFLGAVSDGHLHELYSHAAALVFPSLVEGFGLPILEAMARGTPVLTSAGGATAEVAGDAAVLVDPHSTQSISDGIHRLTHDVQLRRRLSQKGRERAAEFTWDRCARETLAAYSRALRDDVRRG